MPIISRFLGITIMMYFNEHNPPHFHAKYGEYKIIIYIESGETVGQVLGIYFQQKKLKIKIENNF